MVYFFNFFIFTNFNRKSHFSLFEITNLDHQKLKLIYRTNTVLVFDFCLSLRKKRLFLRNAVWHLFSFFDFHSHFFVSIPARIIRLLIFGFLNVFFLICHNYYLLFFETSNSCCINYKTVTGFFVHHLFPCFIYFFGFNDLYLRINFIFCTIIHYGLCFGNATN